MFPAHWAGHWTAAGDDELHWAAIGSGTPWAT